MVIVSSVSVVVKGKCSKTRKILLMFCPRLHLRMTDFSHPEMSQFSKLFDVVEER